MFIFGTTHSFSLMIFGYFPYKGNYCGLLIQVFFPKKFCENNLSTNNESFCTLLSRKFFPHLTKNIRQIASSLVHFTAKCVENVMV